MRSPSLVLLFDAMRVLQHDDEHCIVHESSVLGQTGMIFGMVLDITLIIRYLFFVQLHLLEDNSCKL